MLCSNDFEFNQIHSKTLWKNKIRDNHKLFFYQVASFHPLEQCRFYTFYMTLYIGLKSKKIINRPKALEVMGCKKVIYGKIDDAYKYAIYVKKILFKTYFEKHLYQTW